MAPLSLKARRESYFADCSGCHPLEVFTFIAVPLLSLTLFEFSKGLIPRNMPMQVFFEFVMIALPSYISVSFVSYTSTMLLVQSVAILVLVAHAFLRRRAARASASASASGNVVRPGFLSAYRASLLFSTALCIFAVDFPSVFPKRFAKTSLFGVSVMDVGVGAFVFIRGLAVAKFESDSGAQLSRDSFLPTVATRLRVLAREVASTAPLLILGLARLASISASDYHTITSEYGVHWNFFFTLAALPLLRAATLAVIPRVSAEPAIAGILAVVCVEGLLGSKDVGLATWALSAPRVDLLSSNREGIVSLPGYFSIYMIAISLGRELLPSPTASFTSKSTAAEEVPALRSGPRTSRPAAPIVTLFAMTFVCGVLTALMPAAAICRRLCNLPYVVFVLFICAGSLLFLAVMARLAAALGSSSTPFEGVFLRGANANMLVLFLLSNLLTGAGNLSYNTFDAPPHIARAILFVYAAFLAALCAYCGATGIALKLW